MTNEHEGSMFSGMSLRGAGEEYAALRTIFVAERLGLGTQRPRLSSADPVREVAFIIEGLRIFERAKNRDLANPTPEVRHYHQSLIEEGYDESGISRVSDIVFGLLPDWLQERRTYKQGRSRI